MNTSRAIRVVGMTDLASLGLDLEELPGHESSMWGGIVYQRRFDRPTGRVRIGFVPHGFRSAGAAPGSRLESHLIDKALELGDQILPGVRVPSRWDYQGKRIVGTLVFTLVKVQTRALTPHPSAGQAR